MEGILSLFYSMERANDHKREYENKNNFKYDCVIRLRTDEFFMRPIGPISTYDMNLVNVLKDWVHLDYGLNDRFAFGSSELMDKYLDVYSNFEKLCEMGASVNQECLIGFNSQIRHKLPIAKHDWQYQLCRDVPRRRRWLNACGWKQFL